MSYGKYSRVVASEEKKKMSVNNRIFDTTARMRVDFSRNEMKWCL